MVTPDGRLRFVRASITFGEGFRMSMRRLWMRISNCSRASLWTNVERFTVQRWVSVGSGTGPTTTASKRAAVSIICFTDMSRILCSYAFTRIRSLCSTAGTAGAVAFFFGIAFARGVAARLGATFLVVLAFACLPAGRAFVAVFVGIVISLNLAVDYPRSEEHTSELQ